MTDKPNPRNMIVEIPEAFTSGASPILYFKFYELGKKFAQRRLGYDISKNEFTPINFSTLLGSEGGDDIIRASLHMQSHSEAYEELFSSVDYWNKNLARELTEKGAA